MKSGFEQKMAKNVPILRLWGAIWVVLTRCRECGEQNEEHRHEIGAGGTGHEVPNPPEIETTELRWVLARLQEKSSVGLCPLLDVSAPVGEKVRSDEEPGRCEPASGGLLLLPESPRGFRDRMK